ncbi:hypothetical protein [Streptomyces ambofaciens]
MRLLFLLITQSPFTLAVIVVAPIILARYRAAKYPDLGAQPVGVGLAPGAVGRCAEEPGLPSGLANALVIIADNTVHPAINATVPAVAAMGQSAVGLGHQLAIGRPRRGEVLVPFGEFGAEVEDLLFQLGGPAGEGFDVCRAPRAGGFPGRLPQGLGEATFEPGDVCGQAAVAGGEVRDVGQQRQVADLRARRRAGRGLGRTGENGCVQIVGTVDQAAVNAGRAGDRGDADLLAVGGKLVRALRTRDLRRSESAARGAAASLPQRAGGFRRTHESRAFKDNCDVFETAT